MRGQRLGILGGCLLIWFFSGGEPPGALAGNLDNQLSQRSSLALRSVADGKWNRLVAREWAYRPARQRLCGLKMGRSCGLLDWALFLLKLEELGEMEQLSKVNAYVNAVRFREDRENWGRSDYWAGPGEFFARGGDCEDYAIAKYISLRRLGYPAERLRVVVLRDQRRRQSHAILAVDHNGKTLVLDNLDTEIRDWKDKLNYQAVYAVGETLADMPLRLR